MVCVEELSKRLTLVFGALKQRGERERGDQLQAYSPDSCVSASVNKRVVDLSEELARKGEDCLRQQEEISSLLAQIVDLHARCKGVRQRFHVL